jgi:hypothetical protein
MFVVVVAAGVPLAAWAAPDDGGRVAAAGKIDELVGAIYTEDSVVLPPNHAPIRGTAAIKEYLQPARQELGEFSRDDMTCHPTASSTLVSMACEYNFRSGMLRFNAHEAWRRQGDGSVRNMVDMFGFR